ncbi:MAG TPA: hypothetical protein VM240_01215 [Verrucomicrobiae bacterium]|nr:hypothetical protein [Verrucomicrobiae bacterium]
METWLEHRLRIVYPGGVAWDADMSALGANAQDDRLDAALEAFVRTTGMRVESTFAPPRLARERVITDAMAPDFATWLWRMDNASKIDWIRQHDRVYVALWLKVSRVADYYLVFFNHWHPRGDTGYLDPDCRIDPDPRWVGIAEQLEASLVRQCFDRASLPLRRERATVVMDQGWDDLSDDDPRLDDPDFEPDLVPATMQTCLFGEP